MSFGEPTEWYEAVPSTMEVAAARGRGGAPEGLLVVADSQSAGQGRLGRRWHSPPGGLWLSLLLRPKLKAEALGLIGLAFAVAAAEAAGEVARIPAGVKWPNDVMVNGRKLAGVLAESHVRSSEVEFVVVGMGMNVNIAADAFPEELRKLATSLLSETGKQVSTREVLQAFLRGSEGLYHKLANGDSQHVIERWRKLAVGLNRPVRALVKGEEIAGEALGIAGDGSLLVGTLGGVKAVSSGEVEWR